MGIYMLPTTFPTLFIILIITTVATNAQSHYYTSSVSELFTLKIEPEMFNWTQRSYADNFNYRPSLEGYPDLPSWMQYMYGGSEYRLGYLYGTPPKELENTEIHLEIICLKRDTYETRRVQLTILCQPKKPATSVVQMKIDNMNWIHMMAPGRMEDLKNLYRNDLWQESAKDLHVVFMESATKMGARLPLKPQQTEGVIVHLGSDALLSQQLQDLQNEVKPLYKLTSCNYKKTSVQRIYENAGFTLDWCAFRTSSGLHAGEILHHNSDSNAAHHGSELMNLRHLDKWVSVSRDEAPERNYIDELAFTIAIPTMIFAILITLLTTVLCFQHEIIDDEHSENYFSNIFEIFNECREPAKAPTVQMVQYSDATNKQTTTLKSLKDTPSFLIDNLSLRSQSPTISLYPTDSTPKAGNSYLRPQPPPYKPTPSSSSVIGVSTMNRNGIHI